MIDWFFGKWNTIAFETATGVDGNGRAVEAVIEFQENSRTMKRRITDNVNGRAVKLWRAEELVWQVNRELPEGSVLL